MCDTVCIISFQNHLFKYFYLEPEGQVRSEALELLKEIFEHHVIPETFEEKIYDCISYSVFEDCDECVKVKALSFWDLVIQKQLEHEGMIDGTFPAVTFSKELRKIITFDDATVERCLLRVLHRLNEIGGLNVLLYVFRNEHDDALIKPAIKYITKMADMLLKYDIMSLNSVSPSSNSLDDNTLPDEFVNELLDIETNTIHRYPKKKVTCTQSNNKIVVLDFLKVFHRFCQGQAKKASKNDDLESVLDRIFVK